jgi:hypothetical protein
MSSYLPPKAFDTAMLRPALGRSFHEWNGVAHDFAAVQGRSAPSGADMKAAPWRRTTAAIASRSC